MNNMRVSYYLFNIRGFGSMLKLLTFSDSDSLIVKGEYEILILLILTIQFNPTAHLTLHVPLKIKYYNIN
jgi:hypothetical protein